MNVQPNPDRLRRGARRMRAVAAEVSLPTTRKSLNEVADQLLITAAVVENSQKIITKAQREGLDQFAQKDSR